MPAITLFPVDELFQVQFDDDWTLTELNRLKRRIGASILPYRVKAHYRQIEVLDLERLGMYRLQVVPVKGKRPEYRLVTSAADETVRKNGRHVLFDFTENDLALLRDLLEKRAGFTLEVERLGDADAEEPRDRSFRRTAHSLPTTLP